MFLTSTPAISTNTLIALLGIIVTIGIGMIMASVWIAYRVGKVEAALGEMRGRMLEIQVENRSQMTMIKNELDGRLEDLKAHVDEQTKRMWQERNR